ncbi:Alpha/beta knot methyltransferase [Scheffersomyces amazonensis]|uniref:Alpha/beta knot methyltransferase n=1 Tax=Scheffersomyces amazonensis TaxID=1078765 RepID=UPI00315CAE2F
MIPRRFFSQTVIGLNKRVESNKFVPKTNPFFDGSMEKKKVWEKKGMTKDEFFGKKYGHVKPEDRKRLDEKVNRQRRYREMKSNHLKQRDFDEFGRGPSITMREKQDYLYKNDISKGEESSVIDYVYGTHAVKAVLTANRRVSYNKLYVRHCKDASLIKMAERLGIKVENVAGRDDLNKLTKNGVHNGVVLWTKPLEIPTIYSLEKLSEEEGQYTVTFFDEEKNTRSSIIKNVKSNGKRKPLGLYLDGVTDPQNMGSIIRSAFYFGVDFIITSSEVSAKLGAVTNKASAGALDLSEIYKVQNSLRFLDRVRANGWTVISTSNKPTSTDLENLKTKHSKVEENLSKKYIELSDLGNICHQTPVLLVLGSEGEGIRTHVKIKSDFLVAIDKMRNDEDTIVDSLNVGVASGILLSRCLG